jgi:hypothetical protein
MDLARAPRRAPLTARKKGSGYENGDGREVGDRERTGSSCVFISCSWHTREQLTFKHSNLYYHSYN